MYVSGDGGSLAAGHTHMHVLVWYKLFDEGIAHRVLELVRTFVWFMS
jgi:hypothetical protein